MRSLLSVSLAMLALVGLVLSGCSDDEDTDPTAPTPTDHFNVNYAEFTGLVEEIAPPVYTGPVGAPVGEWDSMWTDGSYPLLGKVFGEDEPMSLYWNTNQLDQAITMLDEVTTQMNAAGVTGDTVVSFGGGTVEYDADASATTIPTSCQSVMGFSTIDLENVFLIEFVQGTDTGHYHLGYTATDSTQAYLTWFNASWGDDPQESFLYYAFVNTNDSSVDIRGCFFKDYGDSTSARWVYDIATVDESDFTYRMSWFSDESEDFSLLGCVVGGGNKDSEFAMKYRQFNPADTTVMDSTFLLEQMFNADYDYLGDIATGYEEFVDEADIFLLEDVPPALIPSPWAE